MSAGVEENQKTRDDDDSGQPDDSREKFPEMTVVQ